jgi:hypothetical protein
MNKVCAIEWLKAHLIKWPSPESGVSNCGENPSPSKWYWIKANATWVCVSEGAPDMQVVTEQDVFNNQIN